LENANSDEIHPYVTIQLTSTGLYVPVYIALTPHGFPQVSDQGDARADFSDAKHDAVEMAKRLGCRYLVPVHG